MSVEPDRSRWELRRNTLRRRGALLGKLARRPSMVVRPCRYAFVLSHMGSRSTLLMHLLGSHPEISGHLETHVRYKRRRDFHKLRIAVSDSEGGAALRRIVIDKVLHRWYVDPELLERMRAHTILLVRRPDEAIPSLRRWVNGRTFEDAARHYQRQLEWLERCAETLPRAIHLDSESLVEDTDAVFRLLEGELGLRSPLREDYRVFEGTGRPGGGDPTKRIRAGRILRDAETNRRQLPAVPAPLLEAARRAHQRCVATLERRCIGLASGPPSGASPTPTLSA